MKEKSEKMFARRRSTAFTFCDIHKNTHKMPQNFTKLLAN